MTATLCTRFNQCDTAAGDATQTQSQCQSSLVSYGLDCAAPAYSNMSVSVDTTNACINELPSTPSCSDWDSPGDAANWGPACNTFWNLFPSN